MTGGRAVVLGETGRNFAAGMSGGIAYVWDAGGGFRQKVNTEMVAIEELDDSDLDYVKGRIERHVAHTGSTRGQAILAAWPSEQKRFVKVMPTDYKRALDELRKLAAQDQQAAKQAEVKVNG
jgi:glutamate synthase (NADPH/NADH) large chain